MKTKLSLIEAVLGELTIAQAGVIKPPELKGRLWIPPTLPTADGRQFAATNRALSLIGDYAELVLANTPQAGMIYTRQDFRALAHRAFGKALTDIDPATPTLPLEDIQQAIDGAIAEEMAPHPSQEFMFGGWFLREDRRYNVSLGPIRIEDRQTWLERAKAEGKVSAVVAGRLERLWSGGRLGELKEKYESVRERGIITAVDACPAVVSVRTLGLTGKSAETKALQAARLALAGIAMLWETPSKSLTGIHLLLDGGLYRERYVVFGERGRFGTRANNPRTPGGIIIYEKFEDIWANAQPWLTTIGEAIGAYVDVDHPTTRPGLINALFLSLWWFEQGCQEKAPLMAAVKFAASMDALAKGGGIPAIVKLVEARLGMEPGSALTTAGRTAKDVITEIYKSARSKTIHGSNVRIAHDWTDTRDIAERLARLCLILCAVWMHENASSDDILALQVP